MSVFRSTIVGDVILSSCSCGDLFIFSELVILGGKVVFFLGGFTVSKDLLRKSKTSLMLTFLKVPMMIKHVTHPCLINVSCIDASSLKPPASVHFNEKNL